MASALPTPTGCCGCGTPLSTTTLDAYIEGAVDSDLINQVGIFAVDTVAALRTIGTSSDNKLATVFGATPSDLAHWKWNNTGTGADDGVTVVRPSDYTTAGVWEIADETAIEIP